MEAAKVVDSIVSVITDETIRIVGASSIMSINGEPVDSSTLLMSTTRAAMK